MRTHWIISVVLTWYFTVPEQLSSTNREATPFILWCYLKYSANWATASSLANTHQFTLNEDMDAFWMDPKQLWKLFNLSTDKNKWLNGFISCLFFYELLHFHAKYVHQIFSTIVHLNHKHIRIIQIPHPKHTSYTSTKANVICKSKPGFQFHIQEWIKRGSHHVINFLAWYGQL